MGGQVTFSPPFFSLHSLTLNCLSAGANRLRRRRGRGTSDSASCAGADSSLRRVLKTTKKACPYALSTQAACRAGLRISLGNLVLQAKLATKKAPRCNVSTCEDGLRIGLGLYTLQIILAISALHHLSQGQSDPRRGTGPVSPSAACPNGQRFHYLTTLQLPD